MPCVAYLNSVKATYNSSEKRKKPQLLLRLMLCRHRLIFPGRFQPSIVSTDELNYRVRDGNGWTLIAKNTDYRCAFNALVSFNVGYYTTTKSVCQYFFESFFEKILQLYFNLNGTVIRAENIGVNFCFVYLFLYAA